MKIELLFGRSYRLVWFLALALSATACGIKTFEPMGRGEQVGARPLAWEPTFDIEPVRHHAQPGLGAPASSVFKQADYGVPASSEVDFSRSKLVTTSDMTY